MIPSKIDLEKKTVKFFSTGDNKLDIHLNGGIPSGTLIHLYGISSSGKTQLALQLCTTIQLPIELGGLEKGAIYMHVEKTFPTTRLDQIASSFKTKLNLNQNLNLLERIDTVYCPTLDILTEIIYERIRGHLEAKISQNIPIGLIIIDNISPLVFSLEKYDNQVYKIIQELNKLSQQYDISIIIINQVSNVVIQNKNKTNQLSLYNQSININQQYIVPNLGLLFRNFIGNQIILSRVKQSDVIGFRKFFTLNCRWCKNHQTDIIIQQGGISSIQISSSEK